MRRYHSLDGLRGLAAAVVVLYHATLIVPGVSDVVLGKVSPQGGSAPWWITRTPFAVLFAGHEAVLLFFVLSGFVLTAPLSRAFNWLAYYPRRMLRLYLPVWGALVLAYVLARIVHRRPGWGSSWLQTHLAPAVHTTFRDAGLLVGTSNLDSPLWSLRWEVWFSLLLPVGWMLLRFLRADHFGGPLIVAMIALTVASRFAQVARHLPGRYGLAAGLLQYLPVFAIGMILALNRARIPTACARIPRGAWPVITGAALLLVWFPHVVPMHAAFSATQAIAYALSVVGVVVLLVATLEWATARTALESRPVQWLGERSFSLYLVHEPILVALALGTRSNTWGRWLPIGIGACAVALLVAHVFHGVVELPTVRLSRAVGRWVARTRPVSEQVAGGSQLGPETTR